MQFERKHNTSHKNPHIPHWLGLILNSFQFYPGLTPLTLTELLSTVRESGPLSLGTNRLDASPPRCLRSTEHQLHFTTLSVFCPEMKIFSYKLMDMTYSTGFTISLPLYIFAICALYGTYYFANQISINEHQPKNIFCPFCTTDIHLILCLILNIY